MLATVMSANVFFWIIPGQKMMVAALKVGQPVDPIHGQRGKQRSVHNTYFALPVLFAMLSGHYSFTYSHPQNWLVLILMMFAGAAIRQFFVRRHGFKLGRNAHPLPFAVLGLAVIAGLVVWLRPAGTPESDQIAIKSVAACASSISGNGQNDYQKLQAVLELRCYQCHGEQVQMKSIRLDSPANVKRFDISIYQQVVLTRQMPLNNATRMTEAERQFIRQWFEQCSSSN